MLMAMNYKRYIRPNIIDTYFAYVVHIIQNKTAVQNTKEIQQKYKSWPCACCKFFCFPHVGLQRHLAKNKQHDSKDLCSKSLQNK